MRRALQGSLLRVLVNPLWDGVHDALLDTLWGAAAADWGGFVASTLPTCCATIAGMVHQQSEMLLQPFAAAPNNLSEFSYFETRMNSFVNDVRFFSSLRPQF